MASRAICTRSLSRLAGSSGIRPCSTTPILGSARAGRRISAARPLQGILSVRTYATEGSAPPSTSQIAPVAKTPEPKLSRTPLYDLHVEHGAKLVPFAGYEMPLTYKWGGQLAEHAQVRKKAGIFDVSHMVQSVISGDGATRFMEHLVPTSLESLRHPNVGSFGEQAQGPFLGSLSVLLNKNGGIIDDLIVTRQGEDSYYIVTNAGRRKEDLTHIRGEIKTFNSTHNTNVKQDVLENRGLIALQGPSAAAVLQKHIPIDLSKLYFGESIFTTIGPSSTRVHIARGGYTGEDGFEISIPPSDSIAVTKLLLASQEVEVQLIGLAARDSLRLEAGMCLYGHDLSEDVTPLEANLTWVVGEDRRQRGDFLGAKPLLDAMAAKSPIQKRIGLLVETGLVAREGTPIYAAGSNELSEAIGKITSGIPSPTLKQNIGMGYVQRAHSKPGTELEVRLRGKTKKAIVTRMPFVKPNYYKRPKGVTT